MSIFNITQVFDCYIDIMYMYILTLKCLLFIAQDLTHITIHLMDDYYDLYCYNCCVPMFCLSPHYLSFNISLYN